MYVAEVVFFMSFSLVIILYESFLEMKATSSTGFPYVEQHLNKIILMKKSSPTVKTNKQTKNKEMFRRAKQVPVSNGWLALKCNLGRTIPWHLQMNQWPRH